MFDLNAYLMDDNNVKPEWVARRKSSVKTMRLNSKIADEFDRKLDGYRQVLPICCADGLEFSAQASAFHYSVPRENQGPWTAVEIGFPNQVVDEFLEYADDPENPTDTVYGRVPVAVVEAVVEKHGGIS